MEAVYREFGKLLRKARLKATLTQEVLGQRVGLSRTSITNIELGNQHVGLHLLYELAKAVGTTPRDLLPNESSLDNSESQQLESVLGGMRQADRTKIEADMEHLSPDVRDRILRLVGDGSVSE